MQLQLLFFSMAPIVAFMFVRERGPLRPALGAAIAVSAIELTYNSYRYGGTEWLSLTSFASFAVLGGIAFHRNDEWYFELQPVVLELILAGVFLYFWYALDTPLLAVILDDHVRIREILPAYQRGYATVYATTLSRSLPYLFLLHAGLTAVAAGHRSRWVWFNVRVFGFYAMLVVLFLVERVLDVAP